MVTFRPPSTGVLTPVDVVIRKVLDACPVLPVRSMSLAKASGLVLAADGVAVAPVPPFDNSSMDGFAFRAADVTGTPFTFTLRNVLEAGDDVATGLLPVGCCDAIMTGAPLPSGADTVVPFEHVTSHDDNHMKLNVLVERGSSVRPAGGDVMPGTIVAPTKTLLTPQALAALVACGVTEVRAHPRPRVTVMATGRELIGGGDGTIPDSNSVYLENALRNNGFDVVRRAPVDDNVEALTAALRDAAANSDVVITTGGVGPGARDLLPTVAAELGSVERYSVAMKPGKPFAFGLLGGADLPVPLFALPGNPVSTMVSFNVTVLPALHQMAGRRPPARRAVVVAELFARERDGKTHFVPARTTTEGLVTRRFGGASHMVASAALADCLVVLPDGEGVPAGESVTILPL